MRMDEDARRLFLKYAVPSCETHVRRREMQQSRADELMAILSENGKLPDDAEQTFKVALQVCGALAGIMHKDSIDADVVREYFLVLHNRVVDEQKEMLRNVDSHFDPARCKTYSGKVINIEGENAVVATELGRRNYKMAFARDVKNGDTVAVHYDFIIEKIPKSWKPSQLVAATLNKKERSKSTS